MEIRNNCNRQNFDGIYRIKKANAEVANVVETSVKPLFEQVMRRPVLSFYGDTPLDVPLVRALDKITRDEHCSYNWLVQNAKNHGINFLDKNNCDVWAFTGEDIKIVTDTLGYAVKDFQKPNLFFKLRLLKDMLFGKFKDVPEHLQEYLLIVEKNKKFKAHFQEQLKGKTIVEVNDEFDLLNKMSLEK